MTAEVPEIKLVKLLMISLTEKYTHDATLYWSDIYCLLQKGNRVTTKMLFKLFSTGVKEEKQADEFLFCFSTLFFHQLLITYNSITNFYPAYSTPLRLPSWLCHAFLQERIQKSSPRARKKLVRSWEGAPKKMCFHSLKKKNGGRVQKIEKKDDFRRTSTWNEKLVICVCSKTHCCDIMPVNAHNCKRHHTNNSVFFCLFYFHRSYYNKYLICKIPANQIIISTYN